MVAQDQEVVSGSGGAPEADGVCCVVPAAGRGEAVRGCDGAFGTEEARGAFEDMSFGGVYTACQSYGLLIDFCWGKTIPIPGELLVNSPNVMIAYYQPSFKGQLPNEPF